MENIANKELVKEKYKIIVNGRPKTVEDHVVTFAQIVALAGFPPPTENTVYTVTYRGKNGHPEGSLVEGASLKIKDGMIFNVTATDRS